MTRAQLEDELTALYDADDYDDARAQVLEDRLGDLADQAGTCRHIGCRTVTDGRAYCPDHQGWTT
jgi:hypothetical protein